MSISHARDMDPRIRILSCDAPERPRRRVDWRLPAAAVLVAGVGVAGTLAVTSVDLSPDVQPVAEQAAVAAQPADEVYVMASADAATFRPTRQLHAAMRDAVNADLRAAARAARPAAVPPPSSPRMSVPAVPADGKPGATSTTVSPGTAPKASVPESSTPEQPPTGVVQEQAPPGGDGQPSRVGPETAPGSGSPVSPQ